MALKVRRASSFATLDSLFRVGTQYSERVSPQVHGTWSLPTFPSLSFSWREKKGLITSTKIHLTFHWIKGGVSHCPEQWTSQDVEPCLLMFCIYLLAMSLAYMLKKFFVLNAGDPKPFDPGFKGPVVER